MLVMKIKYVKHFHFPGDKLCSSKTTTLNPENSRGLVCLFVCLKNKGLSIPTYVHLNDSFL